MKKRRRKNDEHESHERWLVSYADFITLLFAFFVVLYATSTANNKKQFEFQKSIKKYFLGAQVGKAAGISGDGKLDNKAHNAAISNPINSNSIKSQEVVLLGDTVDQFLEEKLSKKQINNYIKDVDTDDRGVRLVLDASKIYSLNSDLFVESALPFLEKLSSLIKKVESQVIIENHYVNSDLGNFNTQWELTAARSSTLLRFLNKKYGVEIQQMVPVGFGNSRPFVNPHSSPKNNRVEIVFASRSI